MGFAIDEIVRPESEALAESLNCSICLRIVDDPVEATCGGRHFFCRGCVAQCDRCPTCRGVFEPQRKFVSWRECNPNMLRMMDAIKVVCPHHKDANLRAEENATLRCVSSSGGGAPAASSSSAAGTSSSTVDHDGSSTSGEPVAKRVKKCAAPGGAAQEEFCSWTGSYGDLLASHLPVCPFALVSCPQRCGEKLRRKDVDTHTQNSCYKCFESCAICGASIRRGQQAAEEHRFQAAALHVDILQQKLADRDAEVAELKQQTGDRLATLEGATVTKRHVTDVTKRNTKTLSAAIEDEGKKAVEKVAAVEAKLDVLQELTATSLKALGTSQKIENAKNFGVLRSEVETLSYATEDCRARLETTQQSCAHWHFDGSRLLPSPESSLNTLNLSSKALYLLGCGPFRLRLVDGTLASTVSVAVDDASPPGKTMGMDLALSLRVFSASATLPEQHRELQTSFHGGGPLSNSVVFPDICERSQLAATQNVTIALELGKRAKRVETFSTVPLAGGSSVVNSGGHGSGAEYEVTRGYIRQEIQEVRDSVATLEKAVNAGRRAKWTLKSSDAFAACKKAGDMMWSKPLTVCGSVFYLKFFPAGGRIGKDGCGLFLHLSGEKNTTNVFAAAKFRIELSGKDKVVTLNKSLSFEASGLIELGGSRGWHDTGVLIESARQADEITIEVEIVDVMASL